MNNELENLKAKLETLENENQILEMSVKDTFDTSQEIIYELQQENEKLKIAIFVVYMKNVDLELLKDCCNLKTYNNRVNFLRELTQQEYDLLKEVLGDA